MESLLLARQPILDRHLKTIGYELLFRPIPPSDDGMQIEMGDYATSEVMISAFQELNIDDVTGSLPAYINFTEHWLEIPPLVNSKRIVVELLENIEPSDKVIAALKRLKKLGHKIALDDYHGLSTQSSLIEWVDIVKVDIRALDSLEDLQPLIQQHDREGLIWLAEKVETQEEYQRCLEAGCSQFQGYFFSKPAPVYGKRVPDNKLAVMQLLQKLNDPDIEIDTITAIVASEPQLSFRLLKIVNSPVLGAYSQVTSIDHAVMLVGLKRLQSWASVLALGQLSDKPKALREQALVRAILCRSFAQETSHLEPDTAFTLGLFSLLDGFMDLSLLEICQRLDLPQMLTKALTNRTGEYGQLLALVARLEQASWDNIEWKNLVTGSTPSEITLMHWEALHYVQELLALESSMYG